MKIGKFTYTPFQVLEERTHKYSSIVISGGGSVAGMGGAPIKPVSSSTTHHSDQGVWVKNLETGSEDKITFPTGHNIEVRPGHRIVVVRNKRKIVRTFVVDTGYSFGRDQIYNPWMFSRAAFVARSAGHATVAMIPWVGPPLLALMFLARGISPRFDASDTPTNTVALVMVAALVAGFLFVHPSGITRPDGDFVGWWLGSHLPFALLAVVAILLAGVAIKVIGKKNDRKISAGVNKVVATLQAFPSAVEALPDLPAIPPRAVQQFFYLDANHQSTGPVTLEWLEQHCSNGLLTNETLVARRGDTAWAPLWQFLDKGDGRK